MGGKRKNRLYFPPILEGYGGEISGYFPPILVGSGGEISGYFPPTWGGNRENFEKSNPQITDSPLGNRISGLKIVKIFACGALMIPHQFPKIFACGAAKKLTFGGYFDRFSIFISPPFWRGMGGIFVSPPPFQRGMGGGGGVKPPSPPLGGERGPLVKANRRRGGGWGKGETRGGASTLNKKKE